ncbi:MAG: hypothetical protein KTR18_08525 [Acidiferrobacterales bacterium]|nr:hypothetical protein [Acidiferrobacterales bacterium]
MLKFFHAPDPLVLPKTVRFPEIKLKGSSKTNAQGYIPFSHIYMTSASQLGHLCKAIDYDGRIIVMGESGEKGVLEHKRCPINLSFRKEGIASALKNSGLEKNDSINVAIVNGMGRGYGDNVSGLGALQHFYRFLSSRFSDVKVDLIQRNTALQGLIYQRYSEVNETKQLPISVTEFYQYDAYIDLTDLLNFDQFHKMPLFDFFLHALSMQKKVLLKRSKHTQLNIDTNERDRLRNQALIRAGLGSRKLVLMHPSASTGLRTMPVETADRLVDYILSNSDALIVSCVPLSSGHQRVVNMSDLSTGIHEFVHIIAACDAVVSVGTVTYHVSGSLKIPTYLIPTVNADIESAKNLSAVKVHMPKAVKQFVSEKHMSRDETDISGVQPIWESVTEKDIAGFLKKALS